MALVGADPEGVYLQRLERLAVDAAELALELQMYAMPKLEALLGMPFAELAEMAKNIDLASIADPRDRRWLEAFVR